MSRSLFALTAVLLAAFTFAPSAGAGVTLGSDLTAPAEDGIFCGSSCVHVQSILPGRTTAAPTDGVVVRWRVRTNNPGGPYALKIARPATGNDRTGAGTSAFVSTAAGGISEFATRLPIKQGDNIGISWTDANSAFFKSNTNPVGAMAPYFQLGLPDGETRTPGIVNTGTELLINADVEVDADGDGYGDESQDACPTISGPDGGCDRIKPKLTKVLAAKQRAPKLAVRLTASEAVSAQLRATVKYRSGGKLRTITGKLTKRSLVAGAPTKLAAKFSSKQLKKLRALLADGKKLRAKIAISAADPSGNKATTSGYVKLKR